MEGLKCKLNRLDFISSRKPVKVTDKAVGYTTIFI